MTKGTEGRKDCLWYGYIFSFSEEGTIGNPGFVLQVCGDALAEKLGVTSDLPKWFDWQYGRKGITYTLCDGEGYSVEHWLAESRDIVERYARTG